MAPTIDTSATTDTARIRPPAEQFVYLPPQKITSSYVVTAHPPTPREPKK